MKTKTLISTALMSSLLLGGTGVYTDDGEILRRSVSSPPGETQNPEPEGEHAFIKLMNFHVPAQTASGELTTIEYNNIDDVLVKTEEKAKPLVNVYVYGPVISFEEPEASGYAGHGRRDAFGAISLDDGATWKVTNLSNSADKSSFEVSTPLQDPGAESGSEFEVTDDWTISEIEYEDKKRGGVLHVKGKDADRRVQVYVRDAITHEVYNRSDRASEEGEWEIEQKRIATAPLLRSGR